jgi:hypothetical protein
MVNSVLIVGHLNEQRQQRSIMPRQFFSPLIIVVIRGIIEYLPFCLPLSIVRIMRTNSQIVPLLTRLTIAVLIVLVMTTLPLHYVVMAKSSGSNNNNNSYGLNVVLALVVILKGLTSHYHTL